MDKPFLSYEVLVNPYYGYSQVVNSATICDVIVENSPLVMATKSSFLPQENLLSIMKHKNGKINTIFIVYMNVS